MHIMLAYLLDSQVKCMAFLVGQGCDINAIDNEGDNALHWAANKGMPVWYVMLFGKQ